MTGEYHLRIIAPSGDVVDAPSSFISLDYSRSINVPGAMTLVYLEDEDERVTDAFLEDTRLQLWRTPPGQVGYLEFETIWFVTKKVTTIAADRKRLVEIGAKSALDLAARRLIAYTAGSAQATINGNADNMIRRIVRENLGDSAGTGRNAGIVVPLNTSSGPVVNKQVGWRGLLQTMQEIARDAENLGTAIYFDLAWRGSALEIVVVTGQPGAIRTEPVLSLENGTLRSASWGFDREGQTNVIYGLGQEYQGARQVVTAVHGSATTSIYSRRETSIEARNATTTAELTAEANAEMARKRPKDVVVAEVANSTGALYGVHWNFGDRITVAVEGNLYQCLVEAVQVSVNQGREQIRATLRF